MRTLPLFLALVTLPCSLAAQALPRVLPAAEGMSAERLKKIDRVIQEAVDSGKVAGVVTMVLRHGKVVQHGAYGWADLENRKPMREDALFRIASQTKAITSVAVMILVEEGRLKLSDPASKWIPSLATAKVATATDSGPRLVPVKRMITIRDLLTHTAGISYGTDASVKEAYQAADLGPAAGYGWYLADKTEPVCASMDRLGTLPFVAQPGTKWVYGYNTDILGCIVERVSGLPLDKFFESRIFTPLGMRNTWFYPPQSVADRLTTVYGVFDGKFLRAPEGSKGQGDYINGPRISFSGGAGLVSTAGDYARFLQMLANGGSLNGNRVLSPMTVDLMHTNATDTLYGGPMGSFGLGFAILKDPAANGVYGNPGLYDWGGAYGSNYWIDPVSGLVTVYMMQLMPNPGLDLAAKLRTLVFSSVER
jgi:CubicO group peptidase (beta-lactamase class C family)